MDILISSDTTVFGNASVARRAKALDLCETIRSKLLDRNGLLVDVPPNELHHVQNMLYVGTTLRGLTSESSSENNVLDLMLGIEILLCPDPRKRTHVYTFKDFVLAGILAALILTSSIPPSVESLISVWQSNRHSPTDSSADLLEFVHVNSIGVVNILIRDSDGVLPTVFLSPGQAAQLTSFVLSPYHGAFPALWNRALQDPQSEEPSRNIGGETRKTSSSILQNMAKVLQETQITWLPGFDGRVRASPSFILILHYFAYCLHPSSPICNNIGILLSTIPWTILPAGLIGQQDGVSVHQLAKEYYEEGLGLLASDKSKKSHPHLLTNYGSLLKEMGDLESAVA